MRDRSRRKVRTLELPKTSIVPEKILVLNRRRSKTGSRGLGAGQVPKWFLQRLVT